MNNQLQIDEDAINKQWTRNKNRNETPIKKHNVNGIARQWTSNEGNNEKAIKKAMTIQWTKHGTNDENKKQWTLIKQQWTKQQKCNEDAIKQKWKRIKEHIEMQWQTNEKAIKQAIERQCKKHLTATSVLSKQTVCLQINKLKQLTATCCWIIQMCCC